MTYKRQPGPTPGGGRFRGFLQKLKEAIEEHAPILWIVLLILALLGWILFILSYLGYIGK
jgi:hypothetical protein